MMAETTELTNNLLKRVMPDAMVFRGYVDGDIENCRDFGVYLLDARSTSSITPTPMPGWNYGYMEVMYRGGDIMQRITHLHGRYIWVRVHQAGQWQPWYRIMLTEVTS